MEAEKIKLLQVRRFKKCENSIPACFRLKYSNMCVGRGAQNRGFGVKIQKYEFPWVQNEFLWVPHAFLNCPGALGAHGGPIFN